PQLKATFVRPAAITSSQNIGSRSQGAIPRRARASSARVGTRYMAAVAQSTCSPWASSQRIGHQESPQTRELSIRPAKGARGFIACQDFADMAGGGYAGANKGRPGTGPGR